MNQYDSLLEAVLASPISSITIQAPVAERNLRKGLNRSIVSHNEMQTILDLPAEVRVLSINTMPDYHFKISLVDKASIKKGKFTFEIITTDSTANGSEDDNK